MGHGRLYLHVGPCHALPQLFLSPSRRHVHHRRPANWVALFVFLLVSITGSQLSNRIRLEADEANQRRREVERLYRFSRKLLGEGNVIQLMNAIPNYIVESFETGAANSSSPKKTNFIAPVLATPSSTNHK